MRRIYRKEIIEEQRTLGNEQRGVARGIENRYRQTCRISVSLACIRANVNGNNVVSVDEEFLGGVRKWAITVSRKWSCTSGGLTFILREITGRKGVVSGNTVKVRSSLSPRLPVLVQPYSVCSCLSLARARAFPLLLPVIDEFFNWQQSYQFSIWLCALMGH